MGVRNISKDEARRTTGRAGLEGFACIYLLSRKNEVQVRDISMRCTRCIRLHAVLIDLLIMAPSAIGHPMGWPYFAVANQASFRCCELGTALKVQYTVQICTNL